MRLALASLVTPKDVGPPVACWSSLCIPVSTDVETRGWLGFKSMAELDSFLFLEWPVLEPVGFMPWETLSAFEEVLGALKTTGLSAAHIANMWSVNGMFFRLVGLQCPIVETEDLSGLDDDILPKYVGIVYVNAIG
ncbi:hypothetical protein Tco_1051891 [Tanacetum coccineum]